MATLRLAAATALVAAVSAQFAPKRGQYFWRIPDTDCMPGDELGYCCPNPPVAGKNCTPTAAICKFKCMENPSCGGFNLPNGHLKKLGCFDELQPWGANDDHHALDVHVLSLYPPRREYWWEMDGYDCNPDHELGNCTNTELKAKWEAGTITPEEKQEYVWKCRDECNKNKFCEGYNVPNGHLKAAGCKYSYFEKEKWGQTLYFVRDHPQERPRSWTQLKEIKRADCAPGQELGNCSQYLAPPYTESECKSACESNPLCGGFNLPNGHLKTFDCKQEVKTDVWDGALYLFEKPKKN